MSNAIEIRNLQKKYGSLTALENLSITIENGTIFGLLGPNGAGKSTTINMIIDFISISSGSIKILGKDFKNKEYKKHIGIVPEVSGLFEQLRGIEQLYFTGKIYGLEDFTIDKRANELFSFFNLSGSEKLVIKSYSKGMKKKLALMCALIHDPKLLIFDEPFEGMDPIAINKTKQLFLSLKKNGKTILITSHILGYLENLCDEIAIINKGKLVYQNSMSNVKSDFKQKLNIDKSLSALEEIFIDTVSKDGNYYEGLSWVNENRKS